MLENMNSVYHESHLIRNIISIDLTKNQGSFFVARINFWVYVKMITLLHKGEKGDLSGPPKVIA